MRILHISSARSFGNRETHLVNLCRGLTERGHEVFVATRPTSNWRENFDFLPPENIFHASVRNAFGVFSAKQIAGFASAQKIEIIHAHADRDYIPASLACRLTSGARFVLTRHVPYALKPFHRLTLTNVARAVAVSTVIGEKLRTTFPPRKIEVIPNGIRAEKRTEEERRKRREEFKSFHQIPSGALTVGIIGELLEQKGQRDFVLAANEIAARRADAFFVVAGKDNSINQQFRRELKRLVKIFDLENRFLWLDWVENTAELIENLDIYVSVPHTESSGLTILDAMAVKTPVVAAETGRAKELLLPGETALLVPPREPVKIAEAVSLLLESEAARERLAANAQAAVEQKFSLDEMIERTENLYREILL